MSRLELKYFVLKPGAVGPHGRASRQALRACASVIDRVDSDLAEQLRSWAEREEKKVYGISKI